MNIKAVGTEDTEKEPKKYEDKETDENGIVWWKPKVAEEISDNDEEEEERRPRRRSRAAGNVESGTARPIR